ncbi:nucleotide-sugar transporter [Choiromyces venosus 120613-1]|uniref:Nucleotide-sugar transporter n=1 Tax=Choiromyces venosus 120613-1 TaxID=1336337 RepID=A0A3N4K061_9PEZI|nr:nucleotide-sugar transporter [Choiromyces venosus 120613-1]
MPKTSANRYFTSTAVFLNELLKLSISIWVAYLERRKIDGSKAPVAKSIKHLCGDVFRPDNWKLAIPACLYTLQNSLQYIAVSNLDAATFQVTYQLKILTTALFSVLMLHRNLTAKKWASLIMLTVGIAIVQLPAATRSMPDNPEMSRIIGLISVAVACTISGLAGVYFEKVLKGSNTTLWVRNVQLSFYSLFPAFFIGVVAKDGKEILERGFFDGYNNVVWSAIGCQALGGIVVALCVNYADNIAKNFATSISILLSFIASIYCFDFEVTVNFMIGAGIVLFATWLYSSPDGLIPKWKQEYIPLEQTDSKADHDGKSHEGEETVGKSSIDGLKRSD